MSVFESFLLIASKVTHVIFGSGKLRPYEKVCIEAWRTTMEPDSQKVLLAQLGKFDHISREPKNLKTVFYRVRGSGNQSWHAGDLFANHDMDVAAFVGDLVGSVEDMEIRVGFTIFIHRGRLFSIEFRSEPGMLRKLQHELRVENGKTLVSL